MTGSDGYSTRVVISGSSSSVTIKGLSPGDYTVTEVTGWSWRYYLTGSSQKITLQPAMSGTVDFANTRSNHKWLSGNAYKKITFDS